MNSEKRSPFLTALFNPVNLSMLALIAAAGLCAAWWLAPVGLLVWLAMFAVIYNDPALRLNNTVASRATLPQRLQDPFERVEKAQIALFNALGSSSPEARHTLHPVQSAADRVVDQAYRLGVRLSNLQNHLIVAHAGQDPQTGLDALKQKLSNASDPAVKQELEASIHAQQEQIDSLGAMAGTLDRFVALLTGIAGALENVVTECVRLAALDRKGMRASLPEVLNSIRGQTRLLQEFEKSLG